MTIERSVVIYFTDKTSVAFSYPQQFDPSLVVQKINQVMDQAYFTVEAEGTLYIYPRDNIKSIQICPAPDKLPDTVVKGATIIES
ncbi:hypothetical protein SAMN02745866_01360 [Alteromonadaceae bacterium Bs31]|nr:hypothetical protein SAMN02745866_01360 [Alteromonadaceae bacterium Bs31]